MKRIKTAIIYITMGLICIAVLFPIILLPLLSIQDSDELAKTTSPLLTGLDKYAQIDYIVQYPTLAHFKHLLIFTPEFYKVFWNSIITVGAIILFQLIISVPSSWAFAQFRFKGKRIIFSLYVIFMLMPFQVTMLSQYLVLNNLSLMNSRGAIILPAIFSTFPVFLMYRGFSDIPKDVLDSARIDGAGEWKIMRHIGLPLGKSGILSCVVLSFLDYWNMVEQPLAFIKDKEQFPLSLYLPMIDLSNAEIILSASVITIVPAVFVFIIGQDYLEQGIISAALKE